MKTTLILLASVIFVVDGVTINCSEKLSSALKTDKEAVCCKGVDWFKDAVKKQKLEDVPRNIGIKDESIGDIECDISQSFSGDYVYVAKKNFEYTKDERDATPFPKDCLITF